MPGSVKPVVWLAAGAAVVVVGGAVAFFALRSKPGAPAGPGQPAASAPAPETAWNPPVTAPKAEAPAAPALAQAPTPAPEKAAAVPAGKPSVTATWSPKVRYAPDETGTQKPGLVGEVRLFGARPDLSITGDGTMTVDLYEVPADDASAIGMIRQRWEIPATALQFYAKEEANGVVYNLYLPWSTYKPETNRVRLSLSYQPATGDAVTVDSPPLQILPGEPPAAAPTTPPPTPEE